mmetsp:Transcript_13838/g.15535  ORF Transcript_13838/g.15535 Transcript_13838/m.15535 type:complete len:179 (+) Transcript_13838:75-611(+)
MYKLLLVLLKIVDLWWSSSCFSIGRGRTTDIRRHRQLLFAEGAPKYQKQNGILQHSECVGEGSYLLHIDYDKNSNDGDGDDSFEDGYYQPGHVLALEIQPPDRTTADIITDTEKSANINAYSLSSSSSSSSFLLLSTFTLRGCRFTHILTTHRTNTGIPMTGMDPILPTGFTKDMSTT